VSHLKWDRFFLGLAEYMATASKDPSTKVGAVIVRPDRTIASMGYNGFPRGARDDETLYADRPTKLLRTVHAELNAILAAREPLHGCEIYVSPLHPCAQCAAAIIQAGIHRLVYRRPTVEREDWAESFKAAAALLREAGVYTTGVPADLPLEVSK
jgi:dCMP deaminase